MKKIRIIAVTYAHTTELEVFIGSLLLQTCRDWTLEVWHDGSPSEKVRQIMQKYESDERVVLRWSESRMGLWGHPNRKTGLDGLQCSHGDYILITNADNYYTPNFVEDMLDMTFAVDGSEVGIVFCDTIHSHLRWRYHRSTLREGGLDMGCGIVRADVAQSVGFRWDNFSADGKYFEACAKECTSKGLVAVHISKGLFVHN